jgi:hypothetical protein
MKAHSKTCEDNFQAGGQACICEQHRPHPPQTNLTVEELLNRTCWCCGAHTREFWDAQGKTPPPDLLWGVWCEREGSGFWRNDDRRDVTVPLRTTREDAERRARNLNYEAERIDSVGWKYSARAHEPVSLQPSTRELIETIRKSALQPKLTPMASVAIREALADLEKRIGGECD